MIVPANGQPSEQQYRTDALHAAPTTFEAVRKRKDGSPGYERGELLGQPIELVMSEQ